MKKKSRLGMIALAFLAAWATAQLPPDQYVNQTRMLRAMLQDEIADAATLQHHTDRLEQIPSEIAQQ